MKRGGCILDNVKRFLTIFQGRQDAYGADGGRAIHQPVTYSLLEGHLQGTGEPVGIYPIRFMNPATGLTWDTIPPEDHMTLMRVRWGCCDIDTGDWNETFRLATALKAMELVPWVERSRSKGWHVWIFVPTSVAAFEMRRCLKVAYAAIGLPAKEANPKSEILRPNQLGNYVRLPYPGGWWENNRQCMMRLWHVDNDGYPMSVDDFLAQDVYSDPAIVVKWASKWREPKRLTIISDMKEGADVDTLVALLPNGARRLYENGPKVKEGATVADTSSGLVGLAHLVRGVGFTPEEAMTVIGAADRRWGKYHERNQPEMYYEDIVRRAYQ